MFPFMSKEMTGIVDVEYFTDEKPYVQVQLYEIKSGFYYIFMDFFERYYSDVIGSCGNIHNIFFSKEGKTSYVFSVNIKFEKSGSLYVANSKKQAHGFYIENEEDIENMIIDKTFPENYWENRNNSL